MAGVYCETCESQVILELDGKSCSNCGRVLVIRAPKPPPPPVAGGPRKRSTKTKAKAGK